MKVHSQSGGGQLPPAVMTWRCCQGEGSVRRALRESRARSRASSWALQRMVRVPWEVGRKGGKEEGSLGGCVCIGCVEEGFSARSPECCSVRCANHA